MLKIIILSEIILIRSLFLLSLVVFVMGSLLIQPTDAYVLPKTNLEKYIENDVILIGNVVSLKENLSEGSTEYEIKIEKFIKNPQTTSTLFVIGTGAKSSEIHLSIEKIFNVKDRVFLFLNERDEKYHISLYSFNALLFNPDDEFLLPPLMLYRAGISSDDIVCRNNLELVLKQSNNSPACVTPNTKAKLVERGWISV